jgi:hypothetical protein
MRSATPIPIDTNGNAKPVFIPDTRKTKAVTLTSNAVVYASTAFASKTPAKASLTVNPDGNNNALLFTAVDNGHLTEDISVKYTDAGANKPLVVTVSGRDIDIQLKTAAGGAIESTAAEVKAAVEASLMASNLVTVAHVSDTGTSGAGVVTAMAKAFLNGWNDGESSVTVRVLLTGDGFIGTFQETKTATMTASMPVMANESIDIEVLPGEIISVKAVDNSKTAYFTPGKKF